MIFEVGDVVVSQEVGLKKFFYKEEEHPFTKRKYRSLEIEKIIDLPPGQEDWESVSKSADPMYIDHIRPPRPGFSYEEDAWVTVMGINGVYGTTPKRLKKVPEGIETWCSRNEHSK